MKSLIELSAIAERLAQPMWLLAQAEADLTGVAEDPGLAGEVADPSATAASTGAPTEGLLTQIFGNPLNLILISGILFILLVLRPQQKQMKEHQSALSSLKKNARVVTSGGIHGTVVQANAGESTVVIRIDDNSGARLTINRDAISKIVADEKPSEKSS